MENGPPEDVFATDCYVSLPGGIHFLLRGHPIFGGTCSRKVNISDAGFEFAVATALEKPPKVANKLGSPQSKGS